MPPKKKPPWRGSHARHLLQTDIVGGIVTKDDDPQDVYASRPEYAPFKENFAKYLKSLLEIVAREKKYADMASKALENDRRIHPPSNDPRGYPVFQGSEAEKRLKEDIDNGLHEQYKPIQLHQLREEYQAWPLDVFRNHIHQELRARIERPYWQQYRKEKKGW